MMGSSIQIVNLQFCAGSCSGGGFVLLFPTNMYQQFWGERKRLFFKLEWGRTHMDVTDLSSKWGGDKHTWM